MATVQDYKDNVYLKSAPYNTCALVGSSGNLKNHAYGDLIDRNDIVIRVNNAPVKGYERMVGHRLADIIILNDHVHDPANCMADTLSGHGALYICTTPSFQPNKDSKSLAKGKLIQDCPLYHADVMYTFSAYIFRTVKDSLTAYAQKYHVNATGHPSSGLKALLFSMLLCRKVHMFGFGMEGATTFHYYSKETEFKRAERHELSLEMSIIKDLANGTFSLSLLDLTDTVFGRVTLHH
jgi:hypothetical protein